MTDQKDYKKVMKLIDEIADYCDLPSKKQTEKICILTGINWSAEELKEYCMKYWSHHSLEETAYFLYEKKYPDTVKKELVFWKNEQGKILGDEELYEKCKLLKNELNLPESISYKEIIKKIEEKFSGWEREKISGKMQKGGCCYRKKEQDHYWTDTHFSIFFYGKEKDKVQLFRVIFYNTEEKEINKLIECFEETGCKLHFQDK